MRERVALAGGKFDVKSRPGHGSAVSVELPVAEYREPQALRAG
jgi:signal transduction histidine kinase